MFDDNIVVNNVYRKINELENLQSEQNKEININPLLKTIFWFVILSTTIYLFKLMLIKYIIIGSLILTLGISVGLALEIKKVRQHTNKYLLAYQEVKNEICDYLSKPHVQKELIKFTQLTFGDKTIDELKKLFASKEHMGAYLYVTQIIKKFLEIEQQKIEQIKNEEMIQQYEKNMKKASRAKLRLVS